MTQLQLNRILLVSSTQESNFPLFTNTMQRSINHISIESVKWTLELDKNMEINTSLRCCVFRYTQHQMTN